MSRNHTGNSRGHASELEPIFRTAAGQLLREDAVRFNSVYKAFIARGRTKTPMLAMEDVNFRAAPGEVVPGPEGHRARMRSKLLGAGQAVRDHKGALSARRQGLGLYAIDPRQRWRMVVQRAADLARAEVAQRQRPKRTKSSRSSTKSLTWMSLMRAETFQSIRRTSSPG